MAQATTAYNPATEKKTKRKRAAKPKRMYLMFEGDVPPGDFTFARNGDDALDQQEAAKLQGKTLNFKRVVLPVSVAAKKAAEDNS